MASSPPPAGRAVRQALEPSGRTYEPAIPLGDGHERGFGWEYIKRTPGINERDDIGEALNEGEIVGKYGPYDIIIGESNDEEFELWLLEERAVAAFHLSTFDSPGVERDIVLNDGYYREHVKGQEDHLSREEIREVVENPDKVFRSVEGSGEHVYVWVKVINGVYYYVRAEDFDAQSKKPLEGIRIRTAYEDTAQKLNNLKRRYDLREIWPNG